jgi:protein-disulfide isomerase
MNKARVFPVAAGLAVLIATAGCASEPAVPVDDAGFGKRVHDYLLANPEVVAEANQALQAKQQAAQREQTRQALAKNRDGLFADGTDPMVGNPSGDITVVEFFDNECPYCKKLAPDLAKLAAADPGVRVVYKEFPILGPGSTTAAKAALAAARQGKYAAFHDALMADHTPEHQLALPRILEIANALDIDTTRLQADMEAPEIGAKIAANIALARALGITGTPGLIIGDKVMPGAVPYQVMADAVAQVRKESHP